MKKIIINILFIISLGVITYCFPARNFHETITFKGYCWLMNLISHHKSEYDRCHELNSKKIVDLTTIDQQDINDCKLEGYTR